MTIVFFTENSVKSDAFVLTAYEKYCHATGKKFFPATVDRTEPKPKLCGNGGENLAEFSLSHSGKYIVCAMSEKPVGVDIQLKKETCIEDISERFFGKKITDKDDFFDEFCKGEATTKLYGIPLAEGLRIREGENYRFFDGYSFAICGGDKPILFDEIKYEQA